MAFHYNRFRSDSGASRHEAHEILYDGETKKEHLNLDLSIGEKSTLLAIVATDAGGHRPAPLPELAAAYFADEEWNHPGPCVDNDTTFRDDRGSNNIALHVEVRPRPGRRTLVIEGAGKAFAVLVVVAETMPATVERSKKVASFWCKTCKISTKALAAAAIAAASMQAIPVAISGAVSAALSLASAAAAAELVRSLVADSIDMATEKFCRILNLCE